MHTRTRRQKEVLEFITRYIEGHGHEPSYQMIARHLGVRSKAGIAKHIAALETQGLLQRRREDGSFKLELSRNEPVTGLAFEIEWLQTKSHDDELEEWERQPFTIPEFMLGGCAPSSLFAFRVPDDAMSGRNIIAGDVALIERRDFVRDGTCVVAAVKKKGVVLRNYYRDGSKIELRSANDAFEPMRFFADQIEIHGIFRGLLRPVS